MKSKWIRKYKLAVMVGCALLFSGASAWADPFMPVSSVREGMHGLAKTVVHGTTIDTFNVDVLGVLKNKGANGGDLVLVKVSGPLIDKTNGIAQGMSGSPVYINGKLLGAVAYGFPQSGGRIGMVTPIEDMLKLWAIDDNESSTMEPDVNHLIPLETPLMASGYTADGMNFLSEKMKGFHMTPYSAASSGEDDRKLPLYPGSSVAATMITGDLKLGAIGTVTYVDGDHILAFGHPFMNAGNTEYFMHNSYIFTVIPSTDTPFKLGSVGAEIGEINQDRGTGISGVSGESPSFVPLHARVTDEDLRFTRNLDVRMIKSQKLLPTLSATSVYNAISSTMDRSGEGTVKFTYTFYPADNAQNPFTRTNMYWSSSDIASRSVDEIYDVLKILADNRFKDYDLRNIDVNMSVTKDRKTARILDATATPMIVSPGDTIYLRVRLQAYRGDVFYKDMTFTVPKDQPYGKMMLEVRGGGVIPLPYLLEQQKYNLSDEVLDRLRTYKNFDDLQKNIMDEDQNNQVVIEILDPNVSMISKEDDGRESAEIQGKKVQDTPDYLHKEDNKSNKDSDNAERPRSRADTDYVIYGDGQFTFTVLPEDKRDAALKKMINSRKKAVAEMHADNENEAPDADSGSEEKNK